MKKLPIISGGIVLLLVVTGLAQEPKEKAKLPAQFGVAPVAALSPDGKLVAIGSDVSMAGSSIPQIVIWDVAAGKQRAVLKGHKGSMSGSGIVSLQFSGDGRLLASGGIDKSIKLWDLEKGKEIATLVNDLPGLPKYLAFSADAKILAASCGSLNDFQLRAWTVPDGKELGTFSDKILGSHIALSRDGKTVAWCSKGAAKLGDVATGKVSSTLAHKGASRSAFSPDGKTLVVAGGSDIKLWDVANGKELWSTSKKITTHQLEFTPDGKKILAASGPGTGEVGATLRSFDAAAGTELTSSTFPKNESRIPAMNSDGSIVLTQFGGQIKVYDLPAK